jgi:hypothetical protein
LGAATFFFAADLRDGVFGAGRFALAALGLAVRFLPEPFDVFLAMAPVLFPLTACTLLRKRQAGTPVPS